MKSLLFLIPVFFLPFISTGQIDTTFYETGKIDAIRDYSKNNKQEYYKNGQLKYDGFILADSEFEAAKIEHRYWYQTGNIKQLTFIDVYEKKLYDNYYFENGNLQQQDISEIRIIENDTFVYYCFTKYLCANGIVSYESGCICCDEILIYEVYHCNGKMKCKSRWYNGILIGEYLEYHANGSLAIKGQYKNYKTVSEITIWKDIKQGLWQYFSENGKLIRTERYSSEGILVKAE